MNKILFSALATSVVGASGFASDTEWSELDRELAAYNTAPLTQESTGPYMSGWWIGSISSSGGLDAGADPVTNPATEDQLGTGVNAGRVNLHGDLGENYSFKLGFDFFDTAELWNSGYTDANNDGDEDDGESKDALPGSAGITDAYVNIGFAEGVSVTIGGFRPTVTMSNNIDRNHTLFVGRSAIGTAYAGRDAGLGLNFGWDRINAQITYMNGSDELSDEAAYTAHADMDILGSSSGYEGAYGAAEGMNLNVGVTYGEDGAVDESDYFAVYANLVTSGFSLSGEMLSNGEGTTTRLGKDNSPYVATAGYMFNEQYEVALRWTDFDDDDDTNRMDLGLNYYVQGHDLKWQLNFSSGSSDVETTDNKNYIDSQIALGLAVGF